MGFSMTFQIEASSIQESMLFEQYIFVERPGISNQRHYPALQFVALSSLTAFPMA